MEFSQICPLSTHSEQLPKNHDPHLIPRNPKTSSVIIMPRAMAPPPSGEFSVRLTQSFGPHYLDSSRSLDPQN